MKSKEVPSPRAADDTKESMASPTNVGDLIDNTRTKKEFAKLRVVSKKLTSDVGQTLEQAQANASTNLDEKKTEASMRTENNISFFVIPSWIIDEVNWLSCMFIEAQRQYPEEIHIMIYDEDIPDGVDFRNDEFLKGLAMQIFQTRPSKLGLKDKSNYEVGRTCMFGLLVRAEFEKTRTLGLAALKPDNQFFGNYPMSKGSRTPDQPGLEIKARMVSTLGSYKYRKTIWSMIQRIASIVRLRGLNDLDYNNTIEKHLRSFDDVSNESRRVLNTKTKRKKQNAKNDVLPSKPSSSPLYLSGEMKEILRIIDPVWTSLEPLKDEWLGAIQRAGFVTVRNEVRTQYTKRWEILSKFASLTTKRLQVVRSFLDLKKSISKRDIESTNIIDWIKSLQDPDKVFWTDISTLVENDKDVIVHGFDTDVPLKSIKDVGIVVRDRICEYYNRVVLIDAPLDRAEVKTESGSRFILKDLKQLRTELSKLYRQGRSIAEATSRIHFPYYGNILTAVQRLRNTYKNYIELLAKVKRNDPDIFLALDKLQAKGNNQSSQTILIELDELVTSSIARWKSDFNVHDVWNPDTQKALTKALSGW